MISAQWDVVPFVPTLVQLLNILSKKSEGHRTIANMSVFRRLANRLRAGEQSALNAKLVNKHDYARPWSSAVMAVDKRMIKQDLLQRMGCETMIILGCSEVI